MTTDRERIIKGFLADAGWGHARRRPLSGDASFRRYERLGDGRSPALLMDAPPPEEDVGPWITMARHLGRMGYSAPRILAADPAAGLLVIEDFGDDTYTARLAAGDDEAILYALAVDLLIDLHGNPEAIAAGIPPYDDGLLREEADLLIDWYLPAMTGQPLPAAARADWDGLWRDLFAEARLVPESLVLRDYHVDNLMWLPGRKGCARCGLLDFQDAVRGPVTYDLMSLLEDARRDMDPGLVAAMTARYLAAFPDLDREVFGRSFAILGAQRHAKVIGIFTRLCRRDGKPVYLRHIPRVWRLLERNLEHPALAGLRRWFDRNMPPDRRGAPEATPA